MEKSLTADPTAISVLRPQRPNNETDPAKAIIFGMLRHGGYMFSGSPEYKFTDFEAWASWAGCACHYQEAEICGSDSHCCYLASIGLDAYLTGSAKPRCIHNDSWYREPFV